MTARQQIYSCGECGQMVAVVHVGGGRLVCHGKPMQVAGEEEGAAGEAARKLRQKPAPGTEAGGMTSWWKCSNCRYVLEASRPPEVCPSCHQNCRFVEVTCYVPECGFSGPDSRLIAG